MNDDLATELQEMAQKINAVASRLEKNAFETYSLAERARYYLYQGAELLEILAEDLRENA